MNCMKCGRKPKGEHIFCEECLAVMERYPVKPGTPIQLPARSNYIPFPAKSAKKRPRKPEEQIPRLRSAIRWLVLALVVAVLAFLAVVIMMLWLLDGPGFFPVF